MKLESKKTNVYSLEYTDWMNDGQVYLTLTEWLNGEGFDVDIESKGSSKHFQLHNDEMQALLVLWGRSNLPDDRKDESD